MKFSVKVLFPCKDAAEIVQAALDVVVIEPHLLFTLELVRLRQVAVVEERTNDGLVEDPSIRDEEDA